jgi:hypothetical protein
MWIPCVLRLDVKNPRLRPFAFRAEPDVSDDRREHLLAKIIRELCVI